MTKMFYGLTRKKQLWEMTLDVCSTLKGPKDSLKDIMILMLATCYQETHMGTLRDSTRYAAGTGIMQFDKMPYNDIKNRSGKYYDICKNEFNIDITKVAYRELELSPLTSIVMARVKYKLVPAKIPSWDDFESVWWYYKDNYNSKLGKATKREFENSYKKAIEFYDHFWIEGDVK